MLIERRRRRWRHCAIFFALVKSIRLAHCKPLSMAGSVLKSDTWKSRFSCIVHHSALHLRHLDPAWFRRTSRFLLRDGHQALEELNPFVTQCFLSDPYSQSMYRLHLTVNESLLPLLHEWQVSPNGRHRESTSNAYSVPTSCSKKVNSY